MAKGYFSYVRVSTQRQGQQGTSLNEQTAAIDRYAKTWNLEIIKRFEERETAAKTGRPLFLEMVKSLKKQKARGVIIHKIDRSARNLRDWAELGSLIDLGIEVHFANESLDLNSRGGRLSADIQAVVASDYIRNLREETIKGIRGRIKQGFYPFPAPLGYKDIGQAKAKEIDPVSGPLIRQAYELYATGEYSLVTLAEKVYELGLRNRKGGRLSKNALHVCLHNPFYVGLLKLSSIPEVYTGRHAPIVTRSLFDRVQEMLDGKAAKKKVNHFFVYRRRIRCKRCENFLVGERQKGHVYYRCHTPKCAQGSIREELVDDQLAEVLKGIEFSKSELRSFEAKIAIFQENEPKRIEVLKRQTRAQTQLIVSRLDRLADAYMDGVFDQETYSVKKERLLSEKIELAEKLNRLDDYSGENITRLREFLELAKSAYLSFRSATEVERRQLVEIVSSNLIAYDKTLLVKLSSPFDAVFDRKGGSFGAPSRDTSRTLSALLSQLLKFFHENRGWSLQEKRT